MEAESLRPNSPFGEWINDDDNLIEKSKLCRLIAYGRQVPGQKQVVLLVNPIWRRMASCVVNTFLALTFDWCIEQC